MAGGFFVGILIVSNRTNVAFPAINLIRSVQMTEYPTLNHPYSEGMLPGAWNRTYLRTMEAGND